MQTRRNAHDLLAKTKLVFFSKWRAAARAGSRGRRMQARTPPLSSDEHGTVKTVKAGFWPWLLGFKSSTRSRVFPLCKGGPGGGGWR